MEVIKAHGSCKFITSNFYHNNKNNNNNQSETEIYRESIDSR